MTEPVYKKSYIASRIFACIAMLISILAIIGWILDIHILRTWLVNGTTAMKFNTAIGIILIAVSSVLLSIYAKAAYLPVRIMASIAFLIGFASMLQYVAGVNFGIDQLVFKDPNLLFLYPGRMSPSTAMTLMIGGIVLICYTFKHIPYRLTQLMLIFILILSLRDLLGYILGINIYEGGHFFTRIAFNSTFAFIGLIASLVIIQPNKGYLALLYSETPAGKLARELLPSALIIPLLLLLTAFYVHKTGLLTSEEIILFFPLLYIFFTKAILWNNLKKIDTLENKAVASTEALNESNYQLSNTNAELAVTIEELSTTNEAMNLSNEKLSLLNDQLLEANYNVEMLSREVLKASENKYKHLTESISDIFFAFDREYNFTFWNHTSEQQSGLKSEEVIGKNLYDLYAGLKDSSVAKCYQEALATGTHQMCIYELAYRGKKAIYEVNSYPSETGLSVFIKDITKAKLVEKQIRDNEERLELALWGADLALWDWNVPTGEIIFNERWAEMLGYRLEELRQHISTWEKLVHPEDMLYADKVLADHLEGKTAFYRTEYRLLAKNGKWKWILDSGKVVERDESQRPVRVIGTHLDITERKEAEESLKNSENKYRGLFEAIKDSIFLFDQQTGQIIDVNPAACQTYGYSREEMLQMKNVDISADPQGSMRSLQNREELVPVRQHRKKNGKIFPVEIALSYFAQQGKMYALSAIRDITQRIKSEEELRIQKEVLQNIIDHLPLMISLFDEQGESMLVNKEWEARLGWRVDDMAGKNMLPLFYPDPEIRKEVTEYMNKAMPAWKVFKTRARTGQSLDVAWANVRLSDGRTIGIGQDVTERKKAELKLQELQSRMEAIITSAMDAIITADENRNIILFNKAAEKMFGYTAEQILGKPVDSLILETPYAKPIENMLTFHHENKALNKTEGNTAMYGIRAEGNEFPIEASISEFKVEDKKYFTVILRDITLREKAEQQEKQLNNELVYQNQQLQQFGYITSHNLRAPIANILGLTEIFNVNDPHDPVNQVAIENIKKATLKLDDIIKDLNEILAYRKSINTTKEWISFQDILDDVSIAISNHIQDSNTEIMADFSQAPEVYSIKSYINSIFQNMLTNAIKYRNFGKTPLISITSYIKEEYICISFADNGMGIDLVRNKDKIFGMYKRFHLHVEGKGLGLHLTKTQIEALNGKIEVESTLGKGTTFNIYLPKE